MGCTACREQHAGSADGQRRWTPQCVYRPSQRNIEGNTPFSEVTVLPVLTITHPAIFRGKKKIKEHLRAVQFIISHLPETKTEKKERTLSVLPCARYLY